MKTLYIIRGISGSGKTHLAHQLCPKWHPLKRAIAADDYPGRYLPDGRLNPTIPHSVAHEWVKETVDKWMSGGLVKTIAVHNVFSKRDYFYDLAAKALYHGWTVQVIHCEWVMVDGDIAKGTHGVPDELQQKWLDEWEPARIPKASSRS